MASIFISYRHDDTESATGRIYDRLKFAFGDSAIFLDSHSIAPGADFRDYLRSHVMECSVMLAIIGQRWLIDHNGERRLEHPQDWVHFEILTAMQNNKTIIPVLVENAPLYRESDLPEDIRGFAFKNAFTVHADPSFDDDVARLISYIDIPVVTAMVPTLVNRGFTLHRRNGSEYILAPMVTIPAGPFLMGSDRNIDGNALSDETPQHTVILNSYKIAKYPLTVAEYACFIQATGRSAPQGYSAQLQRQDNPVYNISWSDALAYVEWLAGVSGEPYRLPTEAEWEKAARGDDGRIYPWGNEWAPGRANVAEGVFSALGRTFFSGAQVRTTPVGSYPQDISPYGLMDVAGNVCEWTSTIGANYPYQATDGREDLGATDGMRMLRGGSWRGLQINSRVAARLIAYVNPNIALTNRGVRVALGR